MTQRLRAMHRGQSGALAIMCLAGILIIAMMTLVLFDTIEIANEKTHLQASADASAHSQASIEARTMNMTAFTNVGKRINIGYVAGYDTIMGWMQWLVGAGWVLTILCAAGAVIFPALAKICGKMARVTAAATCVYAQEEAVDRSQLDDVITGTFGPEIRGLNNYQQFMADITPYWAWSEGVWQGIENAAPITMGYPLPRGDLENTARVPITQPDDHSWDNMCEKANDTPGLSDFGWGDNLDALTTQADRWYMFVDFLIKNGISMAGSGGDYEDPSGDISMDDEDADLGDQCDDLEEMADDDPDVDFDPGEDCDDADDDDDCEEKPPTLTIDTPDGTEVEELTEDCIPVDIAEQLSEFDCSSVSKAGAYGAAFLSGTLGLLVDTSGLPGIVQSVMPTSFKDRCGSGDKSVYTQSSDRYGDYIRDGAAWELDTDNWLMDSSSTIFAYRPNASRNQESRDKYEFVGDDEDTSFLEDLAGPSPSSGAWSMSRGEVTWQGDGDPNLWESEWGARVRPVALPGEWTNYGDGGFTLWDAFQEMEMAMLGAIVVAHGGEFLSSDQAQDLITHPYGVGDLTSWDGITNIANEYQAIEETFEPIDDEDMEGFSK